MRNIESIYLNKAWLFVGGNTPFIDFPTKSYIKNIEITEPDPRNFNGADTAFIKISFEDGYVVKIKTRDYMVGYKKETDNI